MKRTGTICTVCGSDHLTSAESAKWKTLICDGCRVMLVDPRPSMARVKKLLKMVGFYENWLSCVLDRLRVVRGQKPFLCRLRDGHVFLVWLGTQDVQVINEIWLDGVYTPWQDPIPQDWIVVDLGAHKGFFTVKAAQTAKLVLAVEPNPEMMVVLKANLLLNGIDERKVSLIEAAASAEEGEGVLSIPNDPVAASLRGMLPGKRVPVRKVRIAKLLEGLPEIDLLKMDVEGEEVNIFLSSDIGWLERVKRICIEHHGEAVNEICDRLQKWFDRVAVRTDVRIVYAWRV